MKKMSRGEQIKNLKSKKSALLKQRDLTKGRLGAQDAQEQDTTAENQVQEQDTQEILKRATRISIYDRYVR